MRREQRSDILFAVFFAAGLYVAWVLRRALMLVFVAAILAIILGPAIDAVRRIKIGKWRPSRGAATLLLLLVLVGTAVIVGLFGLPPLMREVRLLTAEWPRRLQEFSDRLHSLPFGSHIDAQAIAQGLREFAESIASFFRGMAQAIVALLTLGIM